MRGSLEAVVRGLAPPAGVDEPEPRARRAVVPLEDQRAVARRRRPPPLGERPLDSFGGGGAPEVEVTLRPADPELAGVQSVELTEVVVAHVLEIPRRPAVARNPLLPLGVEDRGTVAQEFVDGVGTGKVRHGEALGRETRRRAARVVERAAVPADALVVRDAACRP